MAEIDLVIFDCDGVLVDSEIIACRVDAEELRKIGVPLSDDDVIARFSGVSSKDMRSILEKDYNVALPSNFFDLTAEITADRIRKELQAIPGIAEALQNFPYAKCVASSSLPEKIELSLTKVGLFESFAPYIYSTAIVKHGKPAPDIFLHAAHLFAVPPEKCVVVEDSVAGIMAANAAGMRSIGFYGGGHCGADHPEKLKQTGATVLLGHMNGLLDALAGLKTASPSDARMETL